MEHEHFDGNCPTCGQKCVGLAGVPEPEAKLKDLIAYAKMASAALKNSTIMPMANSVVHSVAKNLDEALAPFEK